VRFPPFPGTRCPRFGVLKLLVLPIMSHTHASAIMSPSNQASNFQVIFDNALEEYERHTKENLLAHPLAAQLQDCDSPCSILFVLQQQVQELSRSQSSQDRLTGCLDSTINVLSTLSSSIGEGVGLVCFRPSTRGMCTHGAFDSLFHQQGQSSPVSEYSF
jgi:hypothetical protein